jgi:uroporphyrinogen III methyltransferase/synthase
MTPSCIVFKAGTRGSRLARLQTTTVLERIQALVPGLGWNTVVLTTPGDRDRSLDLREAPADFFTRDLDDALRDGRIDLAVHSAKDLPDPVPADLDWGWLPWRCEARDALVLAPGRRVADLPGDARLGVSSDRRLAWVRSRFPAARAEVIRGDIEDRLHQVDTGRYHGTIMAGAALERLGLLDRVSEWIPLDELPTPPGQGSLALTFRAGDTRLMPLRALFTPAIRFVGAGVSDRRWITAAGREALTQAEVCLHDALIDVRLLELLPMGAEVIPVGKRCGHHDVDQDTICRLLVDHLRRGRRVVRLKAGDPGIFGRLAEEVAACAELRLPYEVIPGISSLQLATGTTGKLLTSRGVSRGFAVITPRRAGGERAPIDAQARADLPFAIFMGSHLASGLAAELVADGMAPDTPAAVVRAAGGVDQEVLTTTLAGLDHAAPPRDERPGLILVGGGAGEIPIACGALAGWNVLVTGSALVQDEAARLIRDHGGTPIAAPHIVMAPTPAARQELPGIVDYDWLVVTSPCAASILIDLARTAGLGLQRLPRILACGPGTARVLMAHGLHPDAVPADAFGSAGIVDTATTAIPRGSRILLPRSDRATSHLAEDLRRAGLEVNAPVWFTNRALRPDRLPAHHASVFTSPSGVDAYVAAWGRDAVAPTCVAIGPPTAAALRRQGHAALIAAEATLSGCIISLAGHRVAMLLGSPS